MAKRSINERSSQRVEDIHTVRLVLLKENHLFITGISGKVYEFSGAGAIQDVDEQDANKFLEIDAEKYSCCTGIKASPLFEMAR